jgi:hypothetical protein
MQHPGPLLAVPALALTEPELAALPAKPVLLNEHPQLPAPPAPQQPAGFGGAVPTFVELQLALSPPVSGYGLGQFPPLVEHILSGVHSWHCPPDTQLQQQQQPAMKPHWPGLLPHELPVEIAQASNVGEAAAIAVGAVIDRISGAVAAAVPTFAERTASWRRVTALPLPGPTSTS